MASLEEFTLFSQLPLELRLMVWKRVQQPTRVIGLVPPSQEWYSRMLRRARPREEAHTAADPPWHFRFVVQPRLQHAFALLHANRESRAAWMPWLFQPPRQHRALVADISCMIQFDVQLISYDTDVFAVFEAWKPTEYLGVEPSHPDMPSFVDLFIGLDRSRIRHVAICEIAHEFELSHQALGLHQLRALETLSYLTLGPDVFNQDLPPIRTGVEIESPLASKLEMPVVDVQNLDCQLFDIPSDAVASSPFLNHARPRQAVGLSPDIRPLPRDCLSTLFSSTGPVQTQRLYSLSSHGCTVRNLVADGFQGSTQRRECQTVLCVLSHWAFISSPSLLLHKRQCDSSVRQTNQLAHQRRNQYAGGKPPRSDIRIAGGIQIHHDPRGLDRVFRSGVAAE